MFFKRNAALGEASSLCECKKALLRLFKNEFMKRSSSNTFLQKYSISQFLLRFKNKRTGQCLWVIMYSKKSEEHCTNPCFICSVRKKKLFFPDNNQNISNMEQQNSYTKVTRSRQRTEHKQQPDSGEEKTGYNITNTKHNPL